MMTENQLAKVLDQMQPIPDAAYQEKLKEAIHNRLCDREHPSECRRCVQLYGGCLTPLLVEALRREGERTKCI